MRQYSHALRVRWGEWACELYLVREGATGGRPLYYRKFFWRDHL